MDITKAYKQSVSDDFDDWDCEYKYEHEDKPHILKKDTKLAINAPVHKKKKKVKRDNRELRYYE